jgi:signal peptidase I
MPARLSIQKLYSPKQIRTVVFPHIISESLIFLRYFIVTLIITTVLYNGIRNNLFKSIVVSGESMVPYHSTNDLIYIDLLTPNFSTYKRGDVIVLKAPKQCDTQDDLFIKRVIGLPGEKVSFQNGDVYIYNPNYSNGYVKLDESSYLARDVKTYKRVNPISKEDLDFEKKVEEPVLGNNEYYFMGDNRPRSRDGRECGPINKKDILGKELYRFAPVESRGYFKSPKYNLPYE